MCQWLVRFFSLKVLICKTLALLASHVPNASQSIVSASSEGCFFMVLLLSILAHWLQEVALRRHRALRQSISLSTMTAILVGLAHTISALIHSFAASSAFSAPIE